MKMLIMLLMFGCTIFTIKHLAQKYKIKKQEKQEKESTAIKFSDMHGKQFANYMDYLIEDFK